MNWNARIYAFWHHSLARVLALSSKSRANGELLLTAQASWRARLF